MMEALDTTWLPAAGMVAAVVAFGARCAPRRGNRRPAAPQSTSERAARTRQPAGSVPRGRTGWARSPRLRWALVGLATLSVGLAAPPAAPIALAAGLLVPLARERRRVRRRERALLADLPDVAELLGLALDAGLTVGAALTIAAEHLDGPLADELRAVLRETEVGRRLADSLDALGARAGAGVRPLTSVLADSERSGGAAAEAIRRLAGEARDRRRRQAEEAARRLPVKLLFPLVGCVLPAFALLTVVPVVAGALRALRP